jgi:hypothetical protein
MTERDDETDSGDRDPTDSKVGRLIESDDLTGLGADLEARWTGEAGERTSLRDLADEFNVALLEARLREADATTPAANAASLYETLTGEDASEADRTRAERQLERLGVDPEELQVDFVSYQAIRTYLREYRGAAYEPEDTDPVASALESIQKLRNRLRAVTESTVDRLHAADRLSGGEFRVSVDVRVFCENCGTGYDVAQLLRERGCTCESTE